MTDDKEYELSEVEYQVGRRSHYGVGMAIAAAALAGATREEVEGAVRRAAPTEVVATIMRLYWKGPDA